MARLAAEGTPSRSPQYVAVPPPPPPREVKSKSSKAKLIGDVSFVDTPPSSPGKQPGKLKKQGTVRDLEKQASRERRLSMVRDEGGPPETIPADDWEKWVGKAGGVVFPNEQWKLLWDFVLLGAIMYSCVVVPFRLGMAEDAVGRWWNFELGITIFFITDLCLTFYVAVPDGDELIINKPKIKETYMQFWFWWVDDHTPSMHILYRLRSPDLCLDEDTHRLVRLTCCVCSCRSRACPCQPRRIDASSSFPVELVEIAADWLGVGGDQGGGVRLLKMLRALRLLRLLRLLKIFKVRSSSHACSSRAKQQQCEAAAVRSSSRAKQQPCEAAAMYAAIGCSSLVFAAAVRCRWAWSLPDWWRPHSSFG